MSYRLRRNITAYLMLLPTLIVTAVFIFYPVIDSFIISFFNWNMISDKRPFVGLANYGYILHDPLFQRAFFNTVLYVLCFVPSVLVLGVISAMLLNSKIRFLSVFRTAFFVPYVTSLAASGIVWQWIFNDQFGLLNYLLKQIGLHPQNWLQNPHWTLFNLVFMGVWQNLGYVTVIFLAGLQNISKEYYEAADVDGAPPFQKFRHITVPLLSPTSFFLLILTTIEAFKIFLQIYVLYGASAGPNNSGLTLLYYMYNQGFSDYHMGIATAAAYILFLIIFIFTMIQMLFSKRVHYDA